MADRRISNVRWTLRHFAQKVRMLSLRFYDRATGRLLHTVGQQGEGPGDYGNLDLLQAVGDKLYTFDSWLVRVTIRDGAGEDPRALRRSAPTFAEAAEKVIAN